MVIGRTYPACNFRSGIYDPGGSLAYGYTGRFAGNFPHIFFYPPYLLITVGHFDPEFFFIDFPDVIITIGPYSGQHHGIHKGLKVIFQSEQLPQAIHLHLCIGGETMCIRPNGVFISIFIVDV
jgi:hypothetical protein